MQYHISELLDGLREVDIDIQPDTNASSKRIKELTMKKVHMEENRKKTRRGLTTLSKIVLIAAVIATLALPVMAATGFRFTDWLKGNSSNTGEYDTDLELGSASKAWVISGWTVELSAKNITDKGLTVKCVHWTNQAAAPLTGTLAADESYWLEKWEGKNYVKLADPKTAIPTGKTIPIEKDTTANWPVNWENTYGSLDDGAYRLGKNFTYTSDDGKTETVPVYVKFRVFKQDMSSAVKQCRDMLEEVKNRDSYHVLKTNYTGYRDNSDFTHYTFEFWKSGNDFMEERTYYGKDGSIARHSGYLLRDGKGYSLTWTGDNVLTPLESWEAARFVDWETMEFGWTSSLEIWDNSVGVVSVDETGIQVIQRTVFSDGQPDLIWALTFTQDESGKLTGVRNDSIPGEEFTPDQADPRAKLEILDTAPAEIARTIAAQAVDKPVAFSWAEDQAKYPAGTEGVKTEGFVNTASRSIGDTDTAIAAAQKECTMEFQNTAAVFYDEGAKMWKVELGSSADDTVGQTVYLTEDGITMLVVTK